MAHWLRVIPGTQTVLVTEHSAHTLRWHIVGSFNPAQEIILERSPSRGKHTPLYESRTYQVSECIDQYTYRARRIA